MRIYGSMFVREYVLLFKIGVLSRKSKTPFVLPGEKQKDLCLADQTFCRWPSIVLCSIFFRLIWGRGGLSLSLARDFVLIIIEFDIKNSQISYVVLFSLKFFVLFGLKHDFFS